MRLSNKQPRGQSVSLLPRTAPVKGAAVTTFAVDIQRIEGMAGVLSFKGEEEEKKAPPAQQLGFKQTPVNKTAKKPIQQPVVPKTSKK